MKLETRPLRTQDLKLPRYQVKRSSVHEVGFQSKHAMRSLPEPKLR